MDLSKTNTLIEEIEKLQGHAAAFEGKDLDKLLKKEKKKTVEGLKQACVALQQSLLINQELLEFKKSAFTQINTILKEMLRDDLNVGKLMASNNRPASNDQTTLS